MQKVFFGSQNGNWKMKDLTIRERIVSAALVVAIVAIGLFPQTVIDTAKPALLKTLEKHMTTEAKNQVISRNIHSENKKISTVNHSNKEIRLNI
jgi:NADH-quinone oxidoreductase subunit M